MSDQQQAVELVPGTALPIYAPQSSYQSEGRGQVQTTPARQPAPLFERLANRDDVSPAELVMLEAALRKFDNEQFLEQSILVTQGDQTDGTTGNCILPLFDVPQGLQATLPMVIVDVPGSATITPVAPFSGAGCFAYLAVAPPTSSDNDTVVVAANGLRNGMVAFAPTSSGGPILPGQWTFNDTNAPVAYGGSTFYFVLVGASNGSLTNIGIQVKARVNLYRRGGPRS